MAYTEQEKKKIEEQVKNYLTTLFQTDKSKYIETTKQYIYFSNGTELRQKLIDEIVEDLTHAFYPDEDDFYDYCNNLCLQIKKERKNKEFYL